MYIKSTFTKAYFNKRPSKFTMIAAIYISLRTILVDYNYTKFLSK